jgi:hypothetical protein
MAEYSAAPDTREYDEHFVDHNSNGRNAVYKVLILAPILLAAVASADVFDINASERGWVCTPGPSCAGSGTNNGASAGNNYIAGFGDDGEDRNWFEFAIPDLTGGTLTSATLVLDDGFHGGGDLTYTVYGLTGQPIVFTDVSSSDTAFGSLGTSNASGTTALTITLNAAALAAIGADQGGDIFIGGIDSGENGSIYTDDFESTQDFPAAFSYGSCPVAAGGIVHCVTELDLTTTATTAVPEPVSVFLLGGVLLAFAVVPARRRGSRAIGTD